MKKSIIAILVLAVAVLATSCGHNANQIEIGRLASFGSPEYGKLKYMEGLGATTVGRENTRISISVDSTTGISLDPVTNTLKGISEISIETGPQCNGFVRDTDLEKVQAYYDAVKVYYASRQPAPTISDAKSQQATTSISSVVKAAIASLIGGGGDEPFDCPDGNCTLEKCREHADIAWQASAAAKLLKYSPSTEPPAEEGAHSDYDNLIAFIARVAKLKADGKVDTKLRIDSFSIKDSKLVKLGIGYTSEDGEWEAVNCVECIAFDD